MNKVCRFTQNYLRFAKRWLLPKTCKKLELSKQTGLAFADVVNKVELDICVVQPMVKKLQTKFVDMGGANNLGMLQHRSSENQVSLYTTKLESCVLAKREFMFLDWQKKQVDSSEVIAPELICCEPLLESSICALTMEHLLQPKHYQPEAVIDLYQRMEKLTSKLDTLAGKPCQNGDPCFEMEANTKITRTIKYIVARLHLPEGYQHALAFIEKRKAEFIGNQSEFEQIKQFILQSEFLTEGFDFEKHYGLLHGDFKKANILRDSTGQLRVIDLQYYNYGARLWDMAFFCSKEKEVFGKTYNQFIRPLMLTKNEMRIFILLYILAALLHVKKTNVKKKLAMQVMPAISMVDNH